MPRRRSLTPPRVTSSRWVVGARSVTRAVVESRTRRVLVAQDAPAHLTTPVRAIAAHHAVAVVDCASAAEIGRLCGVSRPVSAAAELTDARPGSS